MGYKVELGYCKPGRNFIEIDIDRWEVSRETTTEVDVPLASDVVRDKKLADARVEVIFD
jgi:hypothetical protein